MLGDLASQLRSRPRQITHILNLGWRHEARPYQAVCEQIRNPHRVVDVALATGDVANVRSIREHQLEPALQDVPDRLPVDAGGLHRYVRDPLRRQRPRRRPAEPHDELTAIHSITSSAMASNVGGTASPSAFAVL